MNAIQVLYPGLYNGASFCRKANVAMIPPILPNPICHALPTERRWWPPRFMGKPTYYNWHGGVAAACNKEKRRILQLQIIRPRQQNSEPNDADSDWDQCEKKPMSQPIRGPGDQHRKHKGRSPWWHGVELCLNRGISISSDDARCEVCISICLKAAC